MLFVKASKEVKKDRYFPIYDSFGNLWWPEKIGHDEIIKMKVKSNEK
jgi:hypothetical protein